MSIKFYVPGEKTDYPYLSSRLEAIPPLGSTVYINRSDNDDIPIGTFKVVEISYNLDIVNKNLLKDHGLGGVVVTLERVL